MHMRPIFAALALCLVACGGAEEKKADDDGTRGGAKELALDKLTDDFIGKENDPADWKFFKIKNRGILRARIVARAHLRRVPGVERGLRDLEIHGPDLHLAEAVGGALVPTINALNRR